MKAYGNQSIFDDSIDKYVSDRIDGKNFKVE